MYRVQLKMSFSRNIQSSLNGGNMTGKNPTPGAGVSSSTVSIKDILNNNPALWFAYGIFLIFNVVALILGLLKGITPQTAIIWFIIMIIMMTILVIFTKAAGQNNSTFALPAKIFIWFVLFMFMTLSISFASALIIGKPETIANILNIKPNKSIIPIGVSPNLLKMKTGEKVILSVTSSQANIEWGTDGGQIVGSGKTAAYTAPNTKGIYAITATDKDDPRSTQRVIAYVEDSPPKMKTFSLEVSCVSDKTDNSGARNSCYKKNDYTADQGYALLESTLNPIPVDKGGSENGCTITKKDDYTNISPNIQQPTKVEMQAYALSNKGYAASAGHTTCRINGLEIEIK
jgi:hypothetical protein